MSSPSAVADEATAGEKAAVEKAAIWAGVGCYAFWGFLPILLKAARWAGAGDWEIVVWRALWAIPVMGAIIVMTRRCEAVLRVLRAPRILGALTASALLIGANWALYVWLVNAGHTLDASLGYFLNPLMSVAAGLVLFRERIGRAGWIALSLAGAGVLVQTFATGHPPWAGLSLAACFCAYGIIRKQVAADAQTGLFVECLVLAPPALAYAIWLQAHGLGHATQPLPGLLLFLGGPATVAPLLAFSWAARRAPLSTMGFLQFISPSIQFVIGLSTGEHLSLLGAFAFALIWAGVAVFAADAWRRLRQVGA
jgi:chloramphenicol-sensitive protein RarD